MNSERLYRGTGRISNPKRTLIVINFRTVSAIYDSKFQGNFLFVRTAILSRPQCTQNRSIFYCQFPVDNLQYINGVMKGRGNVHFTMRNLRAGKIVKEPVCYLVLLTTYYG